MVTTLECSRAQEHHRRAQQADVELNQLLNEESRPPGNPTTE